MFNLQSKPIDVRGGCREAEQKTKGQPVSPSDITWIHSAEREGSSECRTRERDRDRAPESFKRREATMKAIKHTLKA